MSEWIRKLPPAEARREVARRVAAFTGDARQAPIAAAAVASLLAQGRRDFKDRAIREEIESLRSEIRGRFGFSEAQRAEALEAWPAIEELVRSSSPASYAEHLLERSDLEPLGVAGGVLWIGGPAGAVLTLTRRYSRAIVELLEVDDVRGIEARG